MKVARLLAREGNQLKKRDRPHFLRGDTILSFLELKVHFLSPFLPRIRYCDGNVIFLQTWSTPLFDELKTTGSMVLKRRSLPTRTPSFSSSSLRRGVAEERAVGTMGGLDLGGLDLHEGDASMLAMGDDADETLSISPPTPSGFLRLESLDLAAR
jgi:hypothetical protein